MGTSPSAPSSDKRYAASHTTGWARRLGRLSVVSMGRGAASGAATRALLHEHTRTVAEQADRHAVTLESILAILRSPRLDHRTARTRAVDVAAAALVSLRADSDAQRQSLLEPVTGAFERLQNDLRPLIRYGDLQVQFVAPRPPGGHCPVRSPRPPGRSSGSRCWP